MKISLLNTKIEIQASVVTTDKYGNHKNEWKTVYACHATVSAEAAKEESAAGQVVDDAKRDFTIRWCEQAAAVTSTKNRVVFMGDLYDILGVDHMNYKRRCVKLICRKVSR